MNLEEAYPSRDFPWTFYLNGEAMPRWGDRFGLFPVDEPVMEIFRQWDQLVDHLAYPAAWDCLYHRLDHIGDVESEDPGLFRVCCLTAVWVLLRDAETMLATERPDFLPGHVTVAEIYRGACEGLFAMYQRSHADELAFWTSGYPADCERLRERIRRYRLRVADPEWQDAPHVERLRFDSKCKIGFLRGELIALLHTKSLPKEIRRHIHALPKIP